MKIKVSFEYPHSYWIPLIIFRNFFDWFHQSNQEHEIFFESTDPLKRGNPSGPCSPHIMVIRCMETEKYIIVSYWDRAIEFTWPGNGWDVDNCVEIITSAGVHFEMATTPFSYCCYSSEFENYAYLNKIPFEEKFDTSLLFRGFLYAERKIMSDNFPEYFTETRKPTLEYFKELNNSKISLSLDGAGEVCNRDMEILCTGSVLFRPELKQKFYDPLIPNFHYVSVPKIKNPIEQFDVIKKKYIEIKDNYEFLSKISNNGLDWFNRNGSISGNVEILKKLINIEKLF